MINDMASLKQAMEQMDAQDPVLAQAARDQAAQILSRAKSSFSKMAELIEQRHLLLRPKIVASIRRMDQPEMLGDAAFRDAGTALRREGQGFGQIAEAIQLNGNAVSRHENPVRKSEPWYGRTSEPGAPRWVRVANIALRIAFFPVRHPIRSLIVALLATLLGNTLGGVTPSRQVSGFVDSVAGVRQRTDAAVNYLFEKRASPKSQEAAAPTAPAAPAASPPATSPPAASPPAASSPASSAPVPANSAGGSIPPATVPAPSASESAAVSPSSKPRFDARGTTSRSLANDRSQTIFLRLFGDLTPAELRRKSRSAGPCIGGTGGCYWGGR